MLLVVALECQREIEHRFLQQAALSADLIGGDRFEFRAERGIQDAHIRGRGLAAFGRQRLLPGEQRDRRPGEQQAGLAEKRAARLERVWGVA